EEIGPNFSEVAMRNLQTLLPPSSTRSSGSAPTLPISITLFRDDKTGPPVSVPGIARGRIWKYLGDGIHLIFISTLLNNLVICGIYMYSEVKLPTSKVMTLSLKNALFLLITFLYIFSTLFLAQWTVASL